MTYCRPSIHSLVPICILMLGVWVRHAEAGLFDFFLNDLKDKVHGTVENTLQNIDGAVQNKAGLQISVLSQFFGEGVRRKDLTLPQIFSGVFSRNNGIPVKKKAAGGGGWALEDGTVIIGAVSTNGGAVSVSSENGKITVTKNDGKKKNDQEKGATGKTKGSTEEDNSDEPVDDEEGAHKDVGSEDEDEKWMTMSSPEPEPESEPSQNDTGSTTDGANMDDAFIALMSDWDAFISSSIWDAQDRDRGAPKGGQGSGDASTKRRDKADGIRLLSSSSLSSSTARIVNGVYIGNGVAAGAGFSVKFFYNDEATFYCSGSLIGYGYALTAAHCGVLVGDDARVGGTRLRAGLRTRVRTVTKHERFDARTLAHDVALVELAGLPPRGELRRHGVHIAFVNRAHTFPSPGFVGVVSAHGATTTTPGAHGRGAFSDTLRSTRQRARPLAACRRRITQGAVARHASFLCIGDGARSTTCVGDSGAALWRFRAPHPDAKTAAQETETEMGPRSTGGGFQVYGVVSFGEVTDDELCPRGAPSVFQRTSENYDWIEAVVGKHNMA